MYNKKPFIVFEGIEGSGKSFHSRNLINYLKKKKISYIYVREPGGTKNAELIRKILFNKNSDELNKLTDTLLYLAARNENFINNIKPFYKKKIIISDRFTDSTIAYQHYGFGINKNLIKIVHKNILDKIEPDFTFLMKIDINESFKRLKKRSNLNRYDQFSKNYYKNVQNGFIKLSNLQPRKYMIINSKNSITINKKIIFQKFLEQIK
jgi:dTMP kinase